MVNRPWKRWLRPLTVSCGVVSLRFMTGYSTVNVHQTLSSNDISCCLRHFLLDCAYTIEMHLSPSSSLICFLFALSLIASIHGDASAPVVEAEEAGTCPHLPTHSSHWVCTAGLDKLQLIRALWDMQGPAAFFRANGISPPPYSEQEARKALMNSIDPNSPYANPYVDYVSGRAIKLHYMDEAKTLVDSSSYDERAGKAGTMARVVQELRHKAALAHRPFLFCPDRPSQGQPATYMQWIFSFVC